MRYPVKSSFSLFLIFAVATSACGGSSEQSETTLPSTSSTAQASSAETPVETTGTPSMDLLPRSLFFGNPDKASPKLSPNGKFLAFLADRNGVLNVWVAPIDDVANAKPLTSDTDRPVRSFSWAYDNQHILYPQDGGGDENWHIYSTDTQTGTTIDLTPMDAIAARILGVSDKHPESIVVGINNRIPALHDLYTINIKTGKMKLLQENPGFISISIDNNYKVRFGTTMSPDGGMLVMKYGAGKPTSKKKSNKPTPFAEWAPLLTIPQEDSLTTSIIGFDKSGKNIYMWDSRNRNTSALTRMNLKTGKSTVLAEHPLADGEGVHFHPITKKPLAVSFNYAKREWKFLDASTERDFKKLSTLSDGDVNIISATHDNNTWLVAFLDDDGPVKYYHWDRKRQQEKFLFTNRKALVGVKLSRMHDRIIESRDGLKLVNYLSLPPDSDSDGDGVPDEALAMVMLVHGGPWARDRWGYNSLHQLLTNRGYAVISVNFRGSTGFGKNFLNAANKEWAGKMHDDLIDSVNWAVKEGIAQKEKICIMGGSYGGYATLVGLTFTPDTFACGVDIVGPSRIVSLLEAIPDYWKPMQDIFKTRVGDWTTPEGRKMLDERSPLGKVGNIVKPLLIGQGANDPRVKQAEADQIAKAMEARNIPVSYLLFPDEGHGFARPPNNLAFFAATEAFLSAHLGGKYLPATAEEFAGTTVQVPNGLHGIPGFTKVVNDLRKRE